MVCLQWIYGKDWIHSIVVSTAVYYQLSSSKPKGKLWYMNARHPFYTFLLSFGYLVWAHWYQLQTNPSRKFNFTTTQMWLTIKLTSLSYLIHDSKALGKTMKIPSCLEYIGYLYCFTNVLAGPSFSYQIYLDGIDAPRLLHGQKFDGCTDSLYLFMQGLACIYLHNQLSPLFSTEGLLELTSKYGDRSVTSFGYIISYYIFYTAQHRLLFYFGWKWFEGACVMAGFGYNASEKSWTLASNSNIYLFEIGTPSMKRVRYWNISTQQWLQRCIYVKAGRSLLIVYTLNALWHGLDAGYYLFAVVMGILSMVERYLGSKALPFAESRAGELLTWLVCWTLTFLGITYAQVYFYVLTWSNCKLVWKQTLDTTPHSVWITACGMMLLAMLLPLKKKPFCKDTKAL